jgi:hypothetical protein
VTDDAELTMNPFVDVHVHPEPVALPIDVDGIEVITIRCPVRGEGLRLRELKRDSDPDLFAFFATLVANDGEADLDSDADIVPALVQLGFLVTGEDIVAHPRYAVPLPEAGLPNVGADWIVAPSWRYQSEFALHPDLPWPRDYDEQDGRRDVFAGGPAIWVGDPAELVSPFWLPAGTADRAAALVPGGPPPPQPLAGRLAAVGAVVPPGASTRPLSRFADRRAAFAEDGVTVVRGFLPPDELRAVNTYYTAQLDAGLMPFGDRQNARRYSLYNDPLGRYLHTRYTAAFSAVAGEDLRPSFCYFFSYVEGAELLAHKDRPQAEFSISLQLGHGPEPAPGTPTGWPLRFRFDDGRAGAADLALGDAVLYHGREVTHYREPLPAGSRSSLLVLEYVRSDFSGLLV